MTAPQGAVKIALRPIRDGARYFESGDQFDTTTCSLDERQIARLVKHKFIKDFSPEAYRLAIASRPLGTVGRGWSLEFLYSTGAMDRPAEKEKAQATVELSPDDAVHLGYILRLRKFGNFTYVTVLAPNGARMAEKEFKSLRKAHEAIEDFPAAPVVCDHDNYEVLLLEAEGLMDAKGDTAEGRRLDALMNAIGPYEKALLQERSTDSASKAIHEGETPEDGDDGDLQHRSVG